MARRLACVQNGVLALALACSVTTGVSAQAPATARFNANEMNIDALQGGLRDTRRDVPLHVPASFARGLSPDAIKSARVGVVSHPIWRPR